MNLLIKMDEGQKGFFGVKYSLNVEISTFEPPTAFKITILNKKCFYK